MGSFGVPGGSFEHFLEAEEVPVPVDAALLVRGGQRDVVNPCYGGHTGFECDVPIFAHRTTDRHEYKVRLMAASMQLVGREHELVELAGLLAAAASGRGNLVLIAGEPGVGKTRLLREFLERARSAGADTLFGCAYESEGMPPYLPIVEALRQYIQASPAEHLRGDIGDVSDELTRLMPELAGRLPASGFSSEAMDQPLRDAEGGRYRLFESLRSFVVHIAELAPHGLVFALDDLQWAGAPTLHFLLHLARRISAVPILVVGTYRTVELDRSHTLPVVLAELSREGLYRRLAVSPLSRDEVRLLIERVYGAAPAEAVVDAIFREAGGNPFFTIEITRHAGDREQDLRDPSVALKESTVPEGVQLVIGQRVARLSSDADRLMHMAAVLGEPFRFDVLATMLGLEPANVLDALEDGLRAGFIREEADQYHFSHPLVRQALYQDLPLHRRQRLHAQAAAAIEGVVGGRVEPVLGELAVHYRLAGRAGDVDKAVLYSEQAGDHALSLLAYEEAASHWQAALGLVREGGQSIRQAQLLERLGNLNCRAALDFDAGIECLGRALVLYEEVGQDEDTARVHAQLGSAFSSMPEMWDIPRSLTHYRAAEAILAKHPLGSTLGHVYLGLAQAACWNVQVDEGLRASARALEIAEGLEDQALWAEAAILRGCHLCSSGRADQGFALMDRAWEVAQHLRQPTTFFTSFLASAFAHWLGDPGTARAWCERELAKATVGRAAGQRQRFLARLASAAAQTGDLAAGRAAFGEIGTSYDAWHVLFLAGDWDRCQEIAAGQVAECRRRDARAFLFEAVHDLAQLERVRGRHEAAASLQEEVMGIAVDGGELMYELAGRALLGLLYAERGRVGQAEQQVVAGRRIVAASEECRGLTGRLFLAEAVLAAQQGNLAAAEALFGQSIDIFRRYAFPWGEAEALHLWGRALGLAGQSAAAARRFEASLGLYQRLDAGACWCERVRASQGNRAAARPAGLSEREVGVLCLLAAGKTNQQISQELVISPNTVARHVSHIFQKAGVGNRTEAAGWAHREGLISERSEGRHNKFV